MQIAATNYPWAAELEKTVVHSLVTSFGLDFLLFQDKKGGDVNTIHNVRNGTWATEDEKQKYDSRVEYKNVKGAYHQHDNYKATGARDAKLQNEGTLYDPYRGKNMDGHEKRNIDHVISAKEIHDDPGRILAELNGVELANQNSNLQTTLDTINKSKKQTPTEIYLQQLPAKIEAQEDKVKREEKHLAELPRETPQQQHQAKQLEDQIRKNKEKIKKLKQIDEKEMLKRDQEARKSYNESINYTYYTSSKFLKNTALASGAAGLKMGTRQMLGLVLAELWFELRESLPKIINEVKNEFNLGNFLNQIKEALSNIWDRLKIRFNDFLTEFKNGVFSGLISSLTTTIFNIFATTGKNFIKIIRETWGQLIKAIKLLAFNPENLGFVELCKAVTAIINTGVATVIGSVVYMELVPLCNFPFGGELAAFGGALVTGLITLGMNYVILHSEFSKKIWEFIQNLMPHTGAVKQFQEINAELDKYLSDIYRIEFNLNTDDLERFSNNLIDAKDETSRGIILKAEVKKLGIELPFQPGNNQSVRDWLTSLKNK